MLSNAFKGAYVEQVASQHKVEGNIQRGIRDAASIATIAALGFSGALSDSAIIQGAAKMGASRMGGLGGRIVMAALSEKKGTAESKARDIIKDESVDSLDTVFTEASNLSRSEAEDMAIDTVWEILHRKKVDSK